MNTNDGKFIAPVDGIYVFYSQARSSGSNMAYIKFYVNGEEKAYGRRDEDTGEDFVTLSSQLKLNKGDGFWVHFNGYFSNPSYAPQTFFNGHLIRQINS